MADTGLGQEDKDSDPTGAPSFGCPKVQSPGLATPCFATLQGHPASVSVLDSKLKPGKHEPDVALPEYDGK